MLSREITHPVSFLVESRGRCVREHDIVSGQVRLGHRVPFSTVHIPERIRTALRREKPDIVTAQDEDIGLVEGRPILHPISKHRETYVGVDREVLATSDKKEGVIVLIIVIQFNSFHVLT